MQVIEQSSIERRIDALAKDSGADRFGTLPIVWRPNFVTPKRAVRINGMSIAEIVASVDDLPQMFWERGVVTIDRRDGEGSEIVPRAMWRYVRPRADSLVPIEVNLWMPPGNGGRSIISIVASIAIIAATILITGGALAPFLGPLFAAGAFGAQALAAATAIGASLALSALSPPPSVPALTVGSAGAVDTAQSITPASLSGNVLRPGSPIPHVRGRRKIFPPIVVKPLVELVGDDEYATAVFALSGRHDFTNLRADGVPFDDIDELEYETKDGDSSNATLTLITRQSKTDPGTIELSAHKVDPANPVNLLDQTTPTNSIPSWHRMVARGSPDEIWINLAFPEGLFDADNVADPIITPVRVRLREVGDTAWIVCPEIFFTYRNSGRFQKDIRFIFETAPALPTPKTARAPYVAFSHTPMRVETTGTIGDFTNPFFAFNATLASLATRAAANGYIGADFSSYPRSVTRAIVHPSSSTGLWSGGAATTITIKLRGKTGAAPASRTDGTELATVTFTPDTTSFFVLESSDTTTAFTYIWLDYLADASTTLQCDEFMICGDSDFSTAAHSYFWSAAYPIHMNAANIGSTPVRRITLYDDRADIYLDTATFPKGDYEIEIRRGSLQREANLTPTLYGPSIYYDFFRWHMSGATEVVPISLENAFYKIMRQRFSLIFNEHPLPDAPGNLALIAVKVRNRQISQVAVDAALYVNDWNGSSWGTPSTTANPAPHVFDILTGALNADPVPTDLIDSASLVAWRTRCTSEGFEINAVIEGASADVVAQLAAGCGYGRIRQSETFGVIEDKDRSAESPVQTFTSRNSRGYRFEKAFLRRPSGLRCIYADSANDYQETELLVDDPDGDGNARYEEMRYDGLVTEAEVRARALFDLKQARVRMAFHSFEANGQAIKCQRGDLIGLNHPVLLSQMAAGYVREVLHGGSDAFDITGLVLDATIPTKRWLTHPTSWMSGSWLLRARAAAGIRLPDEADITAEFDTNHGAEETRTLTFLNPILGPIEALDFGTLVYCGPVGTERLRLIVGEIQPKTGPSFPSTIVAVDEAPELFAA